MYIVVAILLLAILIMVHEFGHFTAARLMKIADLVTKDSRPVYLIDAVNKILKAESRRRIDDLKSSIQSLVDAQKAKTDLTPEELSRLSSVRLQIKEIKECYVCTPLILSKYLHLQYQEGMKMEDLARKMEPSVIAKFIIEHDGVQWEYLPVKMDAKTYSVRIDEKSSWTSADVRKHLEMPYACPSVITIKNDKNVLADVQNDIKVSLRNTGSNTGPDEKIVSGNQCFQHDEFLPVDFRIPPAPPGTVIDEIVY